MPQMVKYHGTVCFMVIWGQWHPLLEEVPPTSVSDWLPLPSRSPQPCLDNGSETQRTIGFGLVDLCESLSPFQVYWLRSGIISSLCWQRQTDGSCADPVSPETHAHVYNETVKTTNGTFVKPVNRLEEKKKKKKGVSSPITRLSNRRGP